MMFTTLAVYYVTVVGMNPLQLVLVGTVLEVTVFLLEVPTGVVADTYSRRLSVIIGEFLIGACFLIEGFVPLFGAILLAEVIRGVGETFISGAMDAWIADEVGEDKVGRVYLRGGQMGQVGALVGTFVGVGLASIRLNLPVILGGALIVGLGVFLVIAMPERGFKPTPRGERTSWQAMGSTLKGGIHLVRRRPLLLMLLSIEAIFGAFSEGFDRLWEAHLLMNFKFPALWTFKPVVWFGIINVGGMIMGFVASEVIIRRMDMKSPLAMVRALFVIAALLITSVVAFGLAGSFPLAIGAYWVAGIMRTLGGPIYATWFNQNIGDPQVRATVLSMNGQANALGQFVGGPGIGLIGTLRSIRAAMVASGLLLSPALALYGRALKRGGAAPVVPEAQATVNEP
jgi:DHA3 family tetracycline resistance protein-like MFS transporter